MYPIMGNLPKSRVEPTRPFSISGVDYAGPIYIKECRGRSRRTVKAYICVFVCFSTKAVHLELVGDLTTQTFLNASYQDVVMCTIFIRTMLQISLAPIRNY
jgi:hypothetical protein